MGKPQISLFGTYLMFLLLLSFSSIGQESVVKKIDSLQDELKVAQNDTIKVSIYFGIGREYKNLNNDSLIFYRDRVWNLSNQIGYKKGIAFYHYLQGALEHNKSNYDSAIYLYHKALDFFLRSSDTFRLALSYNSIGISYDSKSEYTKALSYYSKALNYYQLLNDKEGISAEYNNIGIVFKSLGEFDSAYTYYYKSAELYLELGIRNDISLIYNNIANLNILLKKYDEALNLLNKSIEINHEIGYYQLLGFNYENMGVLKFNQGLYDEAKQYYDQSIEIYNSFGYASNVSDILKYQGQLAFQLNKYDQSLAFYNHSLRVKNEIGNKLGEAQVLIYMAICLKEYGKVRESIASAKKGLNIAKKISAKTEAAEALEFLYNIYAEQGNYDNAYIYLNDFDLYTDSLFNDQKLKDVGRIESRYVLGQAKKENELLQKEKDIDVIELQQSQLKIENQNTILIALFTSLLFALMATTFWYIYMKRKRKTIFQLKELNDEINQKKNQIESQTVELQRAHSEVKSMNESLENLVEERTGKVQLQNDKLREYAFANSYEVKEPLANLLELTKNLNANDLSIEKKSSILSQIKVSAEMLDNIIKKINDVLREEKL